MATYTTFLLFMAIVFLTCVYSGLSLKCYKCNSEFNGACDNFKTIQGETENCTDSKLVKAFPDVGGTYVCVIHRMAQTDSPHYNVVRGCAPDEYCKNRAFSGSKECIVCDTDLCNSSSAIVPSFVLSIITFLCAKYYFC